MIRSQELIDKLVADLHFHRYLFPSSSEPFMNLKNVMASGKATDFIYGYLDDVFITKFFQTEKFKPIVVPKDFCRFRYTKDGYQENKDDISLNLNDFFDRCTFVSMLTYAFTRDGPIAKYFSQDNFFIKQMSLHQKHFFSIFHSIILRSGRLPDKAFEDYLNQLFGNKHSQYHPSHRGEDLKIFNAFFQGDILDGGGWYEGYAELGLFEIMKYDKGYEDIKNSNIFGEYTIEDLFFLYCLLVEKFVLNDNNLTLYITRFMSRKNDSIVEQFQRFEEQHLDYHYLEDYIDERDLYLRFSNPETSKAFSIKFIDYHYVNIQLFKNNPVRSIFNNNSLPLPFFQESMFNN